MAQSEIPRIVKDHEPALLAEWVDLQQQGRSAARSGSRSQIEAESAEFLQNFIKALQNGGALDPGGGAWESTQDVLGKLSRSRARQGYTPRETANFVFLLKRPLIRLLERELSEPGTLVREVIDASNLLDQLALHTTEVYQKGREEVIHRQQQELLELSTPVIRLWDGILAVPLIGTLDSARTQIVMESLLSEVVRTGASIAVIDITGVPTVDTIVAQHLLKTVAAARLMGADCIISGIRPQIAQTIVHLGVNLGDVTTKASLADAFRHALGLRGLTVGPVAATGVR
jgi:rsbT co-antagonist protein RsbR